MAYRTVLLFVFLVGLSGICGTQPVDATITPSSQIGTAHEVPPTDIIANIQTAPGSGSVYYDGIDILFIIDQSGSMGGADFGVTDVIPNDPLEMRFEGPEYSLEWLNSYLANILPIEDDIRIRVAVLAFGTHPEVQLNWVGLWETTAGSRLEPASAEDNAIWADRLNTILNDISVEDFGRRSLFGTNPVDAFYKAKAIFEQLEGSENHLRAVILMTDGEPCISANCSPTSQYAQAQFQELSLLIKMHMPAPRYQVYGVVINPNDSDWASIQPTWQQALCPDDPARCGPSGIYLQRIRTADELASHFNKILVDVLNFVQPPTVIRCEVSALPGGCDIPPFHQLMRVNIVKNQASPLGGQLTITQPGGSPAIATTITGANSLVEFHAFTDPQPGEWWISITDESLYTLPIFIDRLLNNVQVTTPDSALLYTLIPLQFQVLNSFGQPLSRTAYSPEYALDVQLSLYDITDTTAPRLLETIPLTLDAISPFYQYSAEWTSFDYFGPVEVRATAFFHYNGIPEYLVNDTPLAEFDLRESYILNKGLQQPSILEGESLEIDAAFREKATDLPIPKPSDMGLLVEIRDRNDPNNMIGPLFILGAETSTGEMQADYLISTPGEYDVSSSVVRQVGDSYIPIVNTNRTDQLTVRPIQYLSVNAIFVPNEDEQDAKKFDILGGFPNTETRVRVELTDAQGTPIYLKDVTHSGTKEPAIQILKDGKVVDIDPVLQESQSDAGVYTFVTDALGSGEYQVRVDVPGGDADLRGDYRWSQRVASDTLNRQIPAFVYYTAVAGVGLLLLTGLIVFGFAWFTWYIRSAPLRGTLYLAERTRNARTGKRQTMLLAEINLELKQRNTIRLGKKKLPPPFESMMLTTMRSTARSNAKQVVIRNLQITGDNSLSKRPLELSSGSQKVISSDGSNTEYIVAKDVDPSKQRNLF